MIEIVILFKYASSKSHAEVRSVSITIDGNYGKASCQVFILYVGLHSLSNFNQT